MNPIDAIAREEEWLSKNVDSEDDADSVAVPEKEQADAARADYVGGFSADASMRRAQLEAQLGTYNFTEDMQDALLAAYVNRPESFEQFGEVIRPVFFSGSAAASVVYSLIDFRNAYGRAPKWQELANYTFHRTRLRNTDEAQALVDYVMKLAGLVFDEAAYEFCIQQAANFARERAVMAALRTILQSITDNRQKEQVDPVKVMQEAVMLGIDRKREPRLEDATKFLQTPATVPPEVVHGLLHEGTKLALGGASKAFKTFSLLDLAFSVATGTPWWGMKTTQGKVCFVNCEVPQWAFESRLKALLSAKQVELPADRLYHICLRGFAADAKTLLARVEREIGRNKYTLLVLDPIYKLLGDADENSAGDIANLLNKIEAMLVRTGAAVAFGAHFSKGNQAGKDAIDRISGSGVFARDPDSIMTLTQHEEDDCFTVEAKLRNFKPIDPFVVRWSYPLFGVDGDLNPEKLKPKAGAFKDEHDPKALALLLAEKPLTSAEWRMRALEELGCSESTFYRKKKYCKNVTCEDGRYQISEATVTGK